jgi:hypothetical protein
MLKILLSWFYKAVAILAFWWISLGFVMPALFSAPADIAVVAGAMYMVFFGAVNIFAGVHLWTALTKETE